MKRAETIAHKIHSTAHSAYIYILFPFSFLFVFLSLTRRCDWESQARICEIENNKIVLYIILGDCCCRFGYSVIFTHKIHKHTHTLCSEWCPSFYFGGLCCCCSYSFFAICIYPFVNAKKCADIYMSERNACVFVWLSVCKTFCSTICRKTQRQPGKQWKMY